jgi:hypothetical protein
MANLRDATLRNAMALDLQKVLHVLDGRRVPGLRAGVFIAAAAQALLPVGLIVYIARHANPIGDGMEWVAVVPALLIVAIFVAPALILAMINRLLVVGAFFAGVGILVNLAFYVEIAREFSGAG